MSVTLSYHSSMTTLLSPPPPPPPPPPPLLQLLGYIHQQRNQKGVSEMILRLYNPFLWRALKVANPHVRANAACLMSDAFPLQEPNSTREEINLSMQKQFDAMTVQYLCPLSIELEISAYRYITILTYDINTSHVQNCTDSPMAPSSQYMYILFTVSIISIPTSLVCYTRVEMCMKPTYMYVHV